MKKYYLVFRLSLQNLLEYRMNLTWRILGTVVRIATIYFFWLAILGTGFGNNAYTSKSLGVYYLSITFIIWIVEFNTVEIAHDIRRGRLATDLLRPYNYYIKLFCASLPEKLITLGLFLLVFMFLSQGPKNFFNLALGLLILSVSVAIKYLISLFLGGLAFWFRKVRGFQAVFYQLSALFSGELIPVDLLPPAFLSVANFLPFKYFAYFPARILVGSHSHVSLISELAVQLGWLFVFLLLARIIWQKGLNQFDGAGQ